LRDPLPLLVACCFSRDAFGEEGSLFGVVCFRRRFEARLDRLERYVVLLDEGLQVRSRVDQHNVFELTDAIADRGGNQLPRDPTCGSSLLWEEQIRD